MVGSRPRLNAACCANGKFVAVVAVVVLTINERECCAAPNAPLFRGDLFESWAAGAAAEDSGVLPVAVAPSRFHAEHTMWCRQHGLSYEPTASNCHHSGARIVVWTAGGGYYYHRMFTVFLRRAFSTAVVLWSRSAAVHCYPGTLSLALLSVLPWDEPYDAPVHMPLVIWSGECKLDAPPLHRRPVLHLETRLQVEPDVEFPHTVEHLPYVLVREVPESIPESLRLTEDDVATRPYDVCYIASNCTPVCYHCPPPPRLQNYPILTAAAQ